jgi:uncharacterized phage-associated protein
VTTERSGDMADLYRYDERAAKAAVLYIADSAPKPTFAHIGKILYQADKISLQLYGRPICGDPYIAYADGPLPDHIYQVMRRTNQSDQKIARDWGFRVDKRFVDNGRNPAPIVVPIEEPDLDNLSRSDLKCIDEAIRAIGHLRYGELSQVTHDGAWHKAQERAQYGDSTIALEDIVETLPNGDEILEYLRDPHP